MPERDVALKKSDLYSSLWQSTDQLRGGMDASQYKDYILTLLFVKYVTDKAKSDPNSQIEIPEGGSFDDMVAARNDKEIGDKLNKIIAKLAEANDLVAVLGLADFNDEEKLGKGKEMVDRLSKLVAIFHDIDFSGSRAQGDDLLGDAYEYLMRHFATESGKSKGQFYTPAEVSRIVAKVVGIGPETKQDQTVYDPACGSGSLLLKAAAEAPRGLTIYGQEKDNATWALAKMNMILHSYADADVEKGDTITSPHFVSDNKLRTFDFVVANPPFSLKAWDNGLEEDYGRFEFGRPPNKIGDYAFLLHALKSLTSTGKAAIILPHGVLFRGNAEAIIRRNLVKAGLIKGIIGLPPNLFYGTGIPACIVVLDKAGASDRQGIFMVDASKGFKKDGAKNRLRSRDIHKIVDVFTRQLETDRYSRLVPLTEIKSDENDCNLNISRYIDSSEPEDVQDLRAHVFGGIPDRDVDALSPYWDAFPSLRAGLFTENRPGFVDLAMKSNQVQASVLGTDEFETYRGMVSAVLEEWLANHRASMLSVSAETRPNDLIHELGEDLLERFREVALLDEYDVYEQLLSYWHDVMHDDVFLVMRDGWVGAAKPRPARVVGADKNGKPKYEDAHIKRGTGAATERYVMDLLPPSFIVRRFFAEAWHELAPLERAAADAALSLEEFVSEHTAEDGQAEDAVDEKGKVTQKSANVALKTAKAQDDAEAIEVLTELVELIKTDAAAKKAAKEASAALDDKALARYAKLTEDEVQHLLLDDKWGDELRRRVETTVDALTLALVARIEQLGDRYGHTISDLQEAEHDLSQRVNGHLEAMGVFA